MTHVGSDSDVFLPKLRPLSVVVALLGLVLLWFFSRSAIYNALSTVEQLAGSVNVSHYVWAGPKLVLRSLPNSFATEPTYMVGHAYHEQTWIVECGKLMRVTIGIRAGYFSQSLPSSQACVDNGLTLTSNWRVVPSDIPGQRDTRELSFRIFEFRIGPDSVPLGELANTSHGVYQVENMDLRNDAEGVLTRMWDANAYRSIAATGYHFDGDRGRQQDVAWPFMYPTLIKVVAKLGTIPIPKAMLLLNATLVLAAMVLLFVLGVDLKLNVPVAMIVPAWLVCNPFAYFLFAGFSEPLFLVLECAFVLLLIHKRYFLALGVVVLLGATRFIGYVFVVWLLFAIWTQEPTRSKGKWAVLLATAAAGFLGIAADIGIKWQQTGAPFAAFQVRDAWQVTPFDQWSLILKFGDLSTGGYLPLLLLSLTAFAYAVVAGLGCVKRQAHDSRVNATWVAVLVVAATLLISPEVNSVGRYVFPLAPALVGALAMPNWNRTGLVLLPAVTVLGAMFLPLVAMRIANGLAPW